MKKKLRILIYMLLLFSAHFPSAQAEEHKKQCYWVINNGGATLNPSSISYYGPDGKYFGSTAFGPWESKAAKEVLKNCNNAYNVPWLWRVF